MKDKHLHPDDRKLWSFCRELASDIADAFSLPLAKLRVLSDEKDFFGDCSNDGIVRVQLRRFGRRLLPYQIIDTISHELAHLRHNNHKAEWFALHAEILRSIRPAAYTKLRRLCQS